MRTAAMCSRPQFAPDADQADSFSITSSETSKLA